MSYLCKQSPAVCHLKHGQYINPLTSYVALRDDVKMDVAKYRGIREQQLLEAAKDLQTWMEVYLPVAQQLQAYSQIHNGMV